MTADDRRPEPSHPDLDTLADLHADALDEPAAAQVRAHVDDCAQCAASLSALERVRAELHALPAPALPAEVAARLDATIADLRAGRVPTVEAPADLAERRAARAFDEVEQARLRRGRRRARALTGVAAAVVVIAAGASITAIVRAGDSSTSTSSAAGGSADSAAAPTGSPAVAPNQRNDGSAPEVQQTVPTYDRDGLSAALPELARQHPLPAAGGAVPVGAGAMADPGRRTACAGAIRDAAGTLRAVAQITYRNQPAYVFIYDDDGSLTGYVVSDQCGTPAALPATVLDTVR
jgi:hypothetical protein